MTLSSLKRTLRTATIAGAFVGVAGLPLVVEAQSLLRLSAEFDYFGSEAFTSFDANDNGGPLNGGIAIYRKNVFVPVNSNVLYVTLSTTGDAHGGAALCFTVKVDGQFINPGGQGAARCADGESTPVSGWYNLLKVPVANGGASNCDDGGGGAGDCHDNNIHYTWCRPIAPGNHVVEIRMASSNGGTVFIEQAHFYIDSSTGTAGCRQAATPAGARAAAGSAGAAHGQR